MSDFSPSDPTPPQGNPWQSALPDTESYLPPSASRHPQGTPSDNAFTPPIGGVGGPPQFGFPPPTGTPKQPKKRTWPKVLAGLVGAAVLIVGAVIGVGLLSGGDDEPTSEPGESTDAAAPSDGDEDGSSDDESPDESDDDAAGEGSDGDGSDGDDTNGDASGDDGAADGANGSLSEAAGIILSDGHSSIDVHAPIEDVSFVAKKIAPSVVTISADQESELGTGGSIGTGVIITDDGNILTNSHVVQNATAVRVLLPDTTEPVEAEVLSRDPQNDLALLDISGEGYEAAVFADPEEIRLGDPVIAIGFALDLDGDPSVTLGIVSALNRTLPLDQSTALDGLVQTDAAISSGNSGGPLVNAAGEVVGINTAVATGDAFSTASNLGFAISVDEILQVVPDLRDTANGDIREPGYLGVFLEERRDGGKGAVVTQVEPGTPAAAAGLRDGDIVLDVDGAPINGTSGLIAAIRDREPGDEVAITVLRGGEMVETAAVLVSAPPPAEEG